METQPRVLMVGSVYPRCPEDAEVPWLRETVRRLRERGVEVEVLAPSWKGLKSHTVDGTPVHRFRYGPARWEYLTHDEGAPNKVRSRPWMKLLAIPYVISGTIECFLLCRRKEFTVLHIHWPFPHGLIGMFNSVLLKVPLVLTFHGAELVLARESGIARRVIDWSLRRCRLATANSSYTKELAQAIRPVNVEVLPYGSTFSEDSGRSGSPGKGGRSGRPFRVLFVGRHIERKGVPDLIDATRFFPAEPDWELVIVGSGDRTREWKARAARAGGRILFPGKIETDSLQEQYSEADVFVLPAIVDSRGDTEGLGVVLLEAIAAGLPVVASRVGGIVDVIRHEDTGLLVPPGDPRALAEAIVRVRSDPGMAAKRVARAREHAREFFSWDRLIDRWMDLYQAVSREKDV